MEGLKKPRLMSGQIVWSTTHICSSFIRPPRTVIPDKAVSILTEILRLQLNAACSEILAQVIHIACAWNRKNVRRSTWNGIAAIPPWTDLTRAGIACQVQEATIPLWRVPVMQMSVVALEQ